MKIIMALVIAGIIFCTGACSASSGQLSLEGTWKFKLDPNNIGVKEQWFQHNLPDTIKLPGSTDGGGFGQKATEPAMGRLTRLHKYVGPAWYQKEVSIPAEWKGKRITLFLERCHWETQVWVDGRVVGMQNSLSVPHIYDLSDLLTPGSHVLTICVDNTMKINIGELAHAITDETQTNWNGIVGKIELRATERLYIKSVDTYPDFSRKNIKVRVGIGNDTNIPVKAGLDISLENVTSVKTSVGCNARQSTYIDVNVPFGSDMKLWDEFLPSLHKLSVVLTSKDRKDFNDEITTSIGVREFGKAAHHFTMNGRTIFLRGNLECCIFPLTGYPSTNIDAWLRIYKIAQSYGLNHLRFHSWCPPEAAFAAADQTGFMLQVELPHWYSAGNIGNDPNHVKFLLAEADRILDVYGNHPSFCLMSMGNELGWGRQPCIEQLVTHCRQKDQRHFYTSSTGCSGVIGDGYLVTSATGKGIVRGLDRPNVSSPSTEFDFRASLADMNVPVISHEIGQFAMFPNFDETKKYTGPLRPLNLEVFRKSLAEHKMLGQAEDFRRATGAFMIGLYKEEIESQLRTPTMAGFQLLGIQDFPGQGVALIGILDSFWDSKNLIKPEEFRRFCGPTIPLLRMPKREWDTSEKFTANVEIYHYGQSALKTVAPQWSICDVQGKQIAGSDFNSINIETGDITTIGSIALDLSKITAPQKLTVKVSIKGTDISNSWNIWTYPAEVNVSIPKNIFVSDTWNESTKAALKNGQKVLLFAKGKQCVNAIAARFIPVYWNWPLFSFQPPTMGIFCNPKHPAFAQFPTDFYTDWQWYDLLLNSQAIILDDTPAGFSPIVQFISEHNHNNKLGAIFEANVGKGRLLVSMLDLQSGLDKRLAVRQLRHSILSYMDSESFKPVHKLSFATLDKVLAAPDIKDKSVEIEDVNSAVLNIRAAVHVKDRVAQPWQANADEVIAKAKSFDYSISGDTYRDAQGSAWHGQHVVVNLNCLPKFEGMLYVHFHDWNNQNRAARVFINGKDLGPLTDYSGKGRWLTVPITNEIATDGKLTLDAITAGGPNVMITQLVLIPKRLPGSGKPHDF